MTLKHRSRAGLALVLVLASGTAGAQVQPTYLNTDPPFVTYETPKAKYLWPADRAVAPQLRDWRVTAWASHGKPGGALWDGKFFLLRPTGGGSPIFNQFETFWSSPAARCSKVGLLIVCHSAEDLAKEGVVYESAAAVAASRSGIPVIGMLGKLQPLEKGKAFFGYRLPSKFGFENWTVINEYTGTNMERLTSYAIVYPDGTAAVIPKEELMERLGAEAGKVGLWRTVAGPALKTINFVGEASLPAVYVDNGLKLLNQAGFMLGEINDEKDYSRVRADWIAAGRPLNAVPRPTKAMITFAQQMRDYSEARIWLFGIIPTPFRQKHLWGDRSRDIIDQWEDDQAGRIGADVKVCK